jgi:succinate-acetate transporter protein
MATEVRSAEVTGRLSQLSGGGVVTPQAADPAPLGLAAFGITTLVLSVINAGWVPADTTAGVLALAIAFGGAGQILAGMWAFRNGNTFAGTAFTSFGAFWISFYLLNAVFVPQIKAAGGTNDIGTFVGMYLFAWGVFTAYMTIASIASSRSVTLVFVLLTVTFFLLCAGAWGASDETTKIGGYIGILTAIAAIYASFADVVNDNFHRHIMPTGAHAG